MLVLDRNLTFFFYTLYVVLSFISIYNTGRYACVRELYKRASHVVLQGS